MRIRQINIINRQLHMFCGIALNVVEIIVPRFETEK